MKDLETYRAKNLTVSYEKPSAMKVFLVLLFSVFVFGCCLLTSTTNYFPTAKKLVK
jgi:hypothetical protein